MTPPDSGERCNATLGEDRLVYQCSRPKGHSGQHRDGNVTAWDQAPDSGEREVPEEKPCEGYGKCAPTGICRWCEPVLPRVDVVTRTNPARPGSQFVRDLHDHEAQDWTNYDPRYCHVCGPQAPGAQALRDAKILATYERKYLERIGYMPPATTYMGAPVVFDPNSDRDAPVLVSWPKESAVEKAFREQLATRDGMRPLFSTRQRYSTPEGIASHNAFWEAKLAAQHAALRWERVARRWANKHGPWTLLDFAQHWQFFLNKLIALQFKRIAEIGHPLLPVPPKEPKP